MIMPQECAEGLRNQKKIPKLQKDILDDLFIGQIEEIKLKLIDILNNYKDAIEELQDRVRLLETKFLTK